MRQFPAHLKDSLFIALSGSIGAFLVGLLFFGKNIFFSHNFASQTITFGITISILIAVAQNYHVKNYVITSIIILLLTSLLAKSYNAPTSTFIIRDLIYILSFSSFMFLATFLNNKNEGKPLISFAIYLVFIVLSYITAGIILMIINRDFSSFRVIQLLALIGTIIGIGISLGIIITETLFIRKIKKDTNRT